MKCELSEILEKKYVQYKPLNQFTASDNQKYRGTSRENREHTLMDTYNHSKAIRTKPKNNRNWFKELSATEKGIVLDEIKSRIKRRVLEKVREMKTASTKIKNEAEIEILSKELLREIVNQLKSELSDENQQLLEDLSAQVEWCLVND